MEAYQGQAEDLLEAWRAGDQHAIQLVRTKLPKLELADTQLNIARWYDFRSWPELAAYVKAVTREIPVYLFESVVEAVISGEVATLQSLLREHPELVRARSMRVTQFDPPVHAATLLHYVAANGVEGYRQKTPKNAVEVAEMLLHAGADVDALAAMYGGQHTTIAC